MTQKNFDTKNFPRQLSQRDEEILAGLSPNYVSPISVFTIVSFPSPASDIALLNAHHFTFFSQSHDVGFGLDLFNQVSEDVFRYRLQSVVPFQVYCSNPYRALEVGDRIRLALGPWHAKKLRYVKGHYVPLAPATIILSIIDEPFRHGFTYGTLTGHPEGGEEAFVIEYDPVTEKVSLTISAFARPPHWGWKLALPVTKRVQRIATLRYLLAFDNYNH